MTEKRCKHCVFISPRDSILISLSHYTSPPPQTHQQKALPKLQKSSSQFASAYRYATLHTCHLLARSRSFTPLLDVGHVYGASMPVAQQQSLIVICTGWRLAHVPGVVVRVAVAAVLFQNFLQQYLTRSTQNCSCDSHLGWGRVNCSWMRNGEMENNKTSLSYVVFISAGQRRTKQHILTRVQIFAKINKKHKHTHTHSRRTDKREKIKMVRF